MNILTCYIEWSYQLKEIECILCILGFEYIKPKTINYEIKPGVYEFIDIVDA